MAAAVLDIAQIGFVKNNNEQPVIFEGRALQQRINVVFEPGIGLGQ